MSSENNVLKTPLYDLHMELGGKMVPFAGYHMPVQYKGMGIIKEHQQVRAQAGLFDVSHMGQLIIEGENATRALEAIVPVDIDALGLNKQTYALFTSEAGGILDDLIVTRWGKEQYFLVVNAACKDQDVAHLQQHLGAQAELSLLNDQALMALQGPTAKDVMGELAPQTSELVFMSGCRAVIEGVECYITRSGYTGEDGFEISLPAAQADKIARLILAFGQVEAIGLGARDSLRLEAGLCLYGHDLDNETSPIEGALNWSISKTRRTGGAKEGGFPGADVILAQMANGVSRKRVGLSIDGRVPVREGAQLLNAEGQLVGQVTSGGFAPSLNAPVAMGYVATEYAKEGVQLSALVRDKPVAVQVAKMPFVAQRYFRG